MTVLESDTHCRRIADYCALIAARLDLDAQMVGAASRLHDIGMLATTVGHVASQRALTDGERGAMQSHTRVGHAILAGSATPVLDLAATIALNHHERYDGQGYPRGLAGTDIPEPARIMAVADALDALTTDRPYRRAVAIEDAEAVLTAERRRHFDPVVVDALLTVPDKAAAILDRYPPRPDEQLPSRAPTPPLLTVSAAAAILGIAPSRLRRWADEGRVDTIRSAGGHRRFPAPAVRQLAAELGTPATISTVLAPAEPLPRVARVLHGSGQSMAAAAAASLYTDRRGGWFTARAGTDAVADWLGVTASACERGAYADAAAGVLKLMRRADAYAATLLERHAFLERFGQLLVRALARELADQEEIAGARRLFVVLGQTVLSEYDARSGPRGGGSTSASA